MSAPVDVLAVMDVDGGAIERVIDACSPGTLRQKRWEAHLPIHDAARAAVAELIEAVDAVLPPIGQLDRRSNRGKYELDEDQMHTLQAALARVQGGAL